MCAGILLNVVGFLVSREHISSLIICSFIKENEIVFVVCILSLIFKILGCFLSHNYVGHFDYSGVNIGNSFITSYIKM